MFVQFEVSRGRIRILISLRLDSTRIWLAKFHSRLACRYILVFDLRISTLVWLATRVWLANLHSCLTCKFPLVFDLQISTLVWLANFHSCLTCEFPLVFDLEISTRVWLANFHSCLTCKFPLVFDLQISTHVGGHSPWEHFYRTDTREISLVVLTTSIEGDRGGGVQRSN